MFKLAAAFVKLHSFATVMKTFKRKSSNIFVHISRKCNKKLKCSDFVQTLNYAK